METKLVADLTVAELKAIIAEVVDLRLTQWIDPFNSNTLPLLPKRTKEEQMQRNLAAIEWLEQWTKEGDEEEQRETFEYLQKALDIK